MTIVAPASEDAMLRDAVRLHLSRQTVAANGLPDPREGAHAWHALAAGMHLGDANLEPAHAAIVMEEVGRARTTGPFADCLVTSWLLERCGGNAAQTLATAVQSGEKTAVLAWAEPMMRFDLADTVLSAQLSDDLWHLTGRKSVVGWAPGADLLLVTARTSGAAGDDEGLSLFLVEQTAPHGPTMHAYRTIDGRPAADLLFEDCTLEASALIGPLGGAASLLEEARDRAMAFLAAEAVGLLDVLLEETIAYTGQRRQFGRPIAEFQALQHRMVDMFLECELARSSAWLAVEAMTEVAPARARAISCAMVTVAQAGRFVGEQAIQLHGGMGMTDELPIGHYAKRLMAIEVEWADTDWHLCRLSQGSGRAP